MHLAVTVAIAILISRAVGYVEGEQPMDDTWLSACIAVLWLGAMAYGAAFIINHV